MACGDVLSLEDLQTAKKHQIFEAEVITGKAGGVAGGANIGTATNPVTGQTQQTLPSILADLGFDVQSWTSSTGGVLASANQVFLNDTPGSLGLGDYYAWGGTFPKTVPAGTDPALPTSGYIMRSSRFAGTQAREALRRSYAEAGYNLVDGSFEAGGTLVNANDVLLQERTGKGYTGPAGPVAAGTDPASGGFVDRSGFIVKRYTCTDDMIADATLAAGMYVETMSRYRTLSGGAAQYAIYAATTKPNINGRTDLAASDYVDGYGCFTLANGLVAIPVSPPSFRRWGAISDCVSYFSNHPRGTDSSANVQALIDFCGKTAQRCYVEAGKYHAKNLVQRRVYTADVNAGSGSIPNVVFCGDGMSSSLIYTYGSDFIDLVDVYEIDMEHLTVCSDSKRTPVAGEPQGRGIFSSAAGNWVHARLRKMELQLFEYGVYSPNGSWRSDFDSVSFKFCKTGLKLERLYNSSVRYCNFICQTAIDATAYTIANFDMTHNHFALGTYCAIFGGGTLTDTTLKLYNIDSIYMNNNYMEAYDALSNNSIIMDLKATVVARGTISNNHINCGSNSPIIRRMSGTAANFNTLLKFSCNRYICSGNPRIWEDDGSTNLPVFIFDDFPCTQGSKVIAMNQQFVSSRKSNVSIATGQTTVVLTDIIETKGVGDQQIISSGDLVLPGIGYYEIHTWTRYTSTADITLRLSRSGTVIDLKLAASGTGSLSSSAMIPNTFLGPWTVTLVNGLASGTATLGDLMINIVPMKVSNTLMNKV